MKEIKVRPSFYIFSSPSLVTQSTAYRMTSWQEREGDDLSSPSSLRRRGGQRSGPQGSSRTTAPCDFPFPHTKTGSLAVSPECLVSSRQVVERKKGVLLQ